MKLPYCQDQQTVWQHPLDGSFASEVHHGGVVHGQQVAAVRSKREVAEGTLQAAPPQPQALVMHQAQVEVRVWVALVCSLGQD